MKRYSLLFIAIIIFASSVFASDKSGQFPSFNLEDIDGKMVSLESLLGEKPVIISFWATWCKPCKKELVNFKSLIEERKNDLNFIAITVDAPKSKKRVKPWIKSEKLEDYIVLHDDAGIVKTKAGVTDIPELFILDKTGNIIYNHRGYKNGDENEAIKLIDEYIKNNCTQSEGTGEAQ